MIWDIEAETEWYLLGEWPAYYREDTPSKPYLMIRCRDWYLPYQVWLEEDSEVPESTRKAQHG